MPPASLKPALVSAIDDLLSLDSTLDHHQAALDRLERVVAPLALDPSSNLAHLDRFLASQDSQHLNLTAVLLEHLARSLALDRDHTHARPALVWSNWTRSLRLIQGLLLLHRPSQRLFARRASFEYLLAILDLSRTALPPASPSLASPFPSSAAPPAPFPSPVLFPSTPLSSPRLSSSGAPPQNTAHPDPAAHAATHLALAALDVLLCALVDRPANVRVFEQLDGLAALVAVLKDKAVAQSVRIKVIELLYFYLLPEAAAPSSSTPDPALVSSTTSSTTSTSTSALDERVLNLSNPSSASTLVPAADALPRLFASAAHGFVPQTPTRPRTRPAAPSSTSSGAPPPPRGLERTPSRGRADADAAQREPPSPSLSAAPATPRALRHQRSQSLTALRDLGGAAPARNDESPARRLSAYLPPASPRAGAGAGASASAPASPRPRLPRARHSRSSSSSSTSSASTATATFPAAPEASQRPTPIEPASAPSTPRAHAPPRAVERAPAPAPALGPPPQSPRAGVTRPAQGHRRAQSMLDVAALGRSGAGAGLSQPERAASSERLVHDERRRASSSSSSSSAAAAASAAERAPDGPLERARKERDARRERERERHGAMLPPPLPSSSSASRALPSRPGHARARSSVSSTGATGGGGGGGGGAVQAAVERLERRASVDERAAAAAAVTAGRARERVASSSRSRERESGAGAGAGARAGASRAAYDVGSSGSSASAGSGSARTVGSARSAGSATSSSTTGTASTSLYSSGAESSSSSARARAAAPSRSRPRPSAATRTEHEKKELLRRVMPNVDALEDRFRAMGLGLAP